MASGDIRRLNERREILIRNINDEFPYTSVEIYLDEPWRVKVEITSPQKAAIILKPSDPLMMDENNGFERLFKRGIRSAKRILTNPPIAELIYQGILHLDYNIHFEKYDGVAS
jgi:hypothetical protein